MLISWKILQLTLDKEWKQYEKERSQVYQILQALQRYFVCAKNLITVSDKLLELTIAFSLKGLSIVTSVTSSTQMFTCVHDQLCEIPFNWE